MALKGLLEWTKLVCMNNIVLSGGVVDLDKTNEKASVFVKDNSVLNVFNLLGDVELNIKIDKKCTLNMNMFDYTSNKNIVINVDMDDYSTFNFNNSFITEGKYELKINNNLYGSNITSNVNIRGINEKDGNVVVLMDGLVVGNTHDNILNEYAKVINKSDNSSVMIPNLIVNTNEVVANHGVSIGGFRKDEMFYLRSKGLDDVSISKLLEEGFITSIMEDDVKNRIKNILVGR